jgi:hypothetical protein
VIALVPQFSYTNRYEFTEKATAMLAGKEPKLLQETLDFVMKRQTPSSPQSAHAFGGVGSGSDSSTHHHPVESQYQHTPSSSYPPRTMHLLGGSQRSSNFRDAMMAAPSLEKESTISGRRDDHRRQKLALAELYCACNRNSSFGDLWISLTTDLPGSLAVPNLQRVPGMKSNHQRSTSARSTRSSGTDDFAESEVFRDQMDSLAFSPLETMLQVDALRKPTGKNPINWNHFFRRFDHRRFFSFGLVHGLLVRCHNYPCYPFIFPERNLPLDEGLMIHITDSKQLLKSELTEEKSYRLARSVSSLMDGTRCDDELVCMFEKPFHELVEIVEKFGGKKIVSVFATAPGA